MRGIHTPDAKTLKKRANIKRWRLANPEKAKQQKARWLAGRLKREPDYFTKRARVNRHNNPETAKRQYRKYTQWLRDGSLTSLELRRIWKRDDGRCQYCGHRVSRPRFIAKGPRGFDHVLPRCKGGRNEALNIVVCCKSCNNEKGAQ